VIAAIAAFASLTSANFASCTAHFLKGISKMDHKTLAALLDTYNFAENAIEQHADSMPSSGLEGLLADRDAAFQKLLFHSSDNVHVTIAQLQLMIRFLGSDARKDPKFVRLIVTKCMNRVDHLARTTATITAAESPTRPALASDLQATHLDAEYLQSFNNSSDRIVVIDRDYKYLFSNQANAAFHQQQPKWFTGRPLWDTTNTHFFETVNKPIFDKCFAGHGVAFVAAHPGRDVSNNFSCQVDPIKDAKGEVVAGLAIARLISLTAPANQSPE
jgi:PAS domain-containing protein